MTPILTATNKALAPIRAGKGPNAVQDLRAIAVLPDGKTAYVLNDPLDGGPGTVIPIRTATDTALKPITVGRDPQAIAITPDGKTAYVVNFGSAPSRPGTVTPIRTATNQALRPIKVGSLPDAIAITP